MKVIPMTVGLLGANCYILYCEEKREAAVIDPGGDGEKIINEIKTRDLTLKYILLTHGHFDHIGGVKMLKDKTDAQVAIHEEDAHHLTDMYKNLSFSMGIECIQTPADLLLKDGDRLEVGEIDCKIIHTPGHSKGSICVEVPNVVFTGDTLFEGSVGRTDFMGGNSEELYNSICNKLMRMDDETIVYPGHGDKTTIGKERLTNPFLKGLM